MPNVSEKLTFGLEVEGVTATSESSLIAVRRNFHQHYDHSIKDDYGRDLPRSLEEGGGFEYVSPVLDVGVRMNNVGDHLVIEWGDTQNSVQDLCNCIAHVNKSCGVHVHLGKPKSATELNISRWEPEKVRTMLTIGMLLEPKVFDVVPESRRGNHHSNFIKSRYSSNDLGQFYPTGNVNPRKMENIKRYCWMNLIETRRVGNDNRPWRQASAATGTIEIRALGNTANFDYVSAWVTLWMKVAAYVAYLPTSLAVMRCCMTPETFESDFANLAKLKASVNETAVLPAELPTPPTPAPTRADQFERAFARRTPAQTQTIPGPVNVQPRPRRRPIVRPAPAIPMPTTPTPTLPVDVETEPVAEILDPVDPDMDVDSRAALERVNRLLRPQRTSESRRIDEQARQNPPDV